MLRHLQVHELGVAADEGRGAADHLVQHDAERVDVRALIEPRRAPAPLFRRHVRRRAQPRPHEGVHGIQAGVGGCLRFRDAEVQQLDHRAAALVSVLEQEDVARLHVTMNQAAAVNCRQRAGELQADLDRRPHLQPAQARDPLRQSLTFQQLHHQVGQPIGHDANVQHANHTRVSDGLGRARFVEEPPHQHGVVRHLPAQDLDGHAAPRPRVCRLVHPRHAPLIQAAHDVVVLDPAANDGQRLQKRFGGRCGRHCPWVTSQPSGSLADLAENLRKGRQRCGRHRLKRDRATRTAAKLLGLLRPDRRGP
jgi:hypothetical protein